MAVEHDNSFQAGSFYDTSSYYLTTVQVADFDHDGNPDVALTTDSSTLIVFPGRSNGSLGAPQYFLEQRTVGWSALGDF
nr:FG-GAP repeat protein [Terriglobales bacterium]